MFNVVSSVGRSWPAHGFGIKVGDNSFDALTEGQVHFMQPFVEAGLMAVDNSEGKYSDDERAKLDDTIGRIRATAAIELRQRRALEAQAKADADAGLLGAQIDGTPKANAPKANAQK